MKNLYLIVILLFAPLLAIAQSTQWSGSGIVIGDKYIATNNHVVEGADNMQVIVTKGESTTTYIATVVTTDTNNDLAIIKIDDQSFNGFGQLPYKMNCAVQDIGTSVFVLGYPLVQTMGQDIKLTTGVISAKTGYMSNVSQYQISAPVQPGNSGGPLFDDKGSLIGIVSAKHTEAENAGYAVKLSYLGNLIEKASLNLSMPTISLIDSSSLPEKVKAISPFTVLILASSNSADDGYRTTTPSQWETNGFIEDADMYMKEAAYRYKNGDYKNAYQAICEAVRIYPTTESHYMRGYLGLELNQDVNIAIESFKFCLENKYREEACLYMLSGCYYEKADYNKSIELSSYLIQMDSQNADAWYIRGLARIQLGNKNGAYTDLSQAAKLGNQDAQKALATLKK